MLKGLLQGNLMSCWFSIQMSLERQFPLLKWTKLNWIYNNTPLKRGRGNKKTAVVGVKSKDLFCLIFDWTNKRLYSF